MFHAGPRPVAPVFSRCRVKAPNPRRPPSGASALQECAVSLYLEQIRQLVSLQRVDDAIHGVRTELEQAPQELEDLKKRFAAVNERRENVLEKLAHLTEQEKRLNNEIEEDASRIKKSRSKLMQVSNTREYQAMAREMDNMERGNRSREEERGAVAEEKRRQEAERDAVDADWNALKQELETKQAGLDARLDAARARLDELDRIRAQSGNEVPRPVLDRYEFIRRRLPHPVIVPVTAGVCEGCRIMIPPQTFIELQGGHKILNCPNCQRLIYWSEHFDAGTNKTCEDDPAEGAASAESDETAQA